jgi:hypothetical protein
VRPTEEFQLVQRLISSGLNDCEVARQSGIPRATVRDWRRREHIRERPTTDSACGILHDFEGFPANDYCYLLGLYLGDGCISRMGRVWRLRITLDQKYPKIIERCRMSIDNLMPGQHAAVSQQPKGCVVVGLYSKHWPCLFPQHGPGRKHARRIALEPWQQQLVNRSTEQFVRGLIDSDGCRVVANDRGVESVRYHFSNRSNDILGLFTEALDALDVPWTRPSTYGIAVYRKVATARLDQFIGPKT